jgi:hypothetical protein
MISKPSCWARTRWTGWGWPVNILATDEFFFQSAFASCPLKYAHATYLSLLFALMSFWNILHRLRFGVWVLLLGLLAGCTSADDDHYLLFNSDFEQFQGWVEPLPAFLTTEKARSGRYAFRVSENTEFSNACRTTLEGLPFLPSKLRLQAWTYLPNRFIGSTSVVVQVNCHGRRPNIWNRLALEQVVTRYEQWEYLTKTIDLPADLEPTDEVTIYIWCPTGGPPRYFDDLTLEGWR